MKKIALPLLVFLLSVVSSFAQKTKFTKAEKATLDSMMKNDEFLKLLKKDKSYFDISIGMGNRLFSEKNNSVNASQAETNKIFYNPAVSYHHKSGLSINISPYLSSDSGSLTVYQTGITPAYDYQDEKWGAGISYTRFLADNNKYNTKSTYQNDFYVYGKYLKPFIQPGLVVGYTSGKYKEINLVTFTPPLPLQPRIVKDSTSNKISDFTITASAEHAFELDKIFTRDDGITITPQFMLNAGSEKLIITHTNQAYAKLISASRRVNKRSTTQNGSTGFALQSAAFSLDLLYGIGKFYIEPNIYLDYYLPSTTAKRVSTFYSITAGISF